MCFTVKCSLCDVVRYKQKNYKCADERKQHKRMRILDCVVFCKE